MCTQPTHRSACGFARGAAIGARIDPDPFRAEDLVEGGRELAVAVADQEARAPGRRPSSSLADTAVPVGAPLTPLARARRRRAATALYSRSEPGLSGHLIRRPGSSLGRGRRTSVSATSSPASRWSSSSTCRSTSSASSAQRCSSARDGLGDPTVEHLGGDVSECTTAGRRRQKTPERRRLARSGRPPCLRGSVAASAAAMRGLVVSRRRPFTPGLRLSRPRPPGVSPTAPPVRGPDDHN
jgi:hypothetical protein